LTPNVARFSPRCRREENRAFGKDEEKDRNRAFGKDQEPDSTSLTYQRVPAACINHLMRSVRSLTALVNAPSSDPACCERTNDRSIVR